MHHRGPHRASGEAHGCRGSGESPKGCSWKVGAWEPFTDGSPTARNLPTPPHQKGENWPAKHLVECYTGMWRGKGARRRNNKKTGGHGHNHGNGPHDTSKPNLPPIATAQRQHPPQHNSPREGESMVTDMNSALFPTVGRDGIYTEGLKRLLLAKKRSPMKGYAMSKTSYATSMVEGGEGADDEASMVSTAASLLQKIKLTERKHPQPKAAGGKNGGGCAGRKKQAGQHHRVPGGAGVVPGLVRAHDAAVPPIHRSPPPRGSLLFSPFPLINAGPQLPVLFTRTRVHQYHGRAYACE